MSRGNLQTVLMPVAMVAGGLLHHPLGQLRPVTPYLIFAMLFIPFCGLRLGEMRVTRLHLSLLAFQAVAGVAAWWALRGADEVVAQGAMICFVAPTASAAVVIASMLGARVETMLTYSLLVNMAAAVGLPLLFALVAPSAEVPFAATLGAILLRVVPVLVLPFAAAVALRRVAPRVAERVRGLKMVPFYLWLGALTVTTAGVVNFVATQGDMPIGRGAALAGGALAICLVQFFVGKWIGRRHGETTAGGQALGQKNTILAIWLAQSCLNPASSVAPAAYVLWQTIFNSVQLWLRSNREQREQKEKTLI